jgi:hypothetical protein
LDIMYKMIPPPIILWSIYSFTHKIDNS